MSQIFINFRAQDEPGYAALLDRELSRSFGRAAVFFAGTSISPGDDFMARLDEGVRRAVVLLAVIGPRWLSATHSSGRRYLDRDDDWVRREIAQAISHDIRVIPILVGDTERLTDVPLPRDIGALSRCQYLRLRHDNVDYDLARIHDSLHRVIGRGAHPTSCPVRPGRS